MLADIYMPVHRSEVCDPWRKFYSEAEALHWERGFFNQRFMVVLCEYCQHWHLHPDDPKERKF